MYAKTHADIPLSAEELEAEIIKMKAALTHFTAVMEARLIEKLQQGWRGWDDPANAREIYTCLVAHAAAIPGAVSQEPDIANFAMFLFHIRTGRRPDPDAGPVAARVGPRDEAGGAAAVVEPIEKRVAA